jgi:RNA polymerase sigma-B factor
MEIVSAARCGDSRKQVAQLQRAYHEGGNVGAREQLIEAYLPLVRSLAQRFAGRGERIEDLVQVGSIGLIKAVDRFEPERGVGLATFAIPNILGEIRRHLRDRATLVRIPRREQGASAPLRDGARAPLPLGDATGPAVSEDDAFRRSEDRVVVSSSLSRLHRREREALRCRFFADMTQVEIARRLGISQTQASRLLASGLAKMRADLGGDAGFSGVTEVNSSHGDSRRRQGRAA